TQGWRVSWAVVCGTAWEPSSCVVLAEGAVLVHVLGELDSGLQHLQELARRHQVEDVHLAPEVHAEDDLAVLVVVDGDFNLGGVELSGHGSFFFMSRNACMVSQRRFSTLSMEVSF